jgi:hypothetical protein
MVEEDKLPWHMRAYLHALEYPSFEKHCYLLNGKSKGRVWKPNAELIAPYFSKIRSPSSAYPHSWYRAAITFKFRNWYLVRYQEVFRISDLEMSVLRAIYIQRSTPHDLSHAPQAQAHA